MSTLELPYSALASIPQVLDEIRQVYRQHTVPWVIGYSGGKDSTTALYLVWRALEGLPAEERTKTVYVISSDTLVETPVIVDYITDAIDLIKPRRRGAKHALHRPQAQPHPGRHLLGQPARAVATRPPTTTFAGARSGSRSGPSPTASSWSRWPSMARSSSCWACAGARAPRVTRC